VVAARPDRLPSFPRQQKPGCRSWRHLNVAEEPTAAALPIDGNWAERGLVFGLRGIDIPDRMRHRLKTLAISGAGQAWQKASHSPVIFARSPVRLKAA
jgi:hypothetical protein